MATPATRRQFIRAGLRYGSDLIGAELVTWLRFCPRLSGAVEVGPMPCDET